MTRVFIFSPKRYLGNQTLVMHPDSFAVHILKMRCLSYILFVNLWPQKIKRNIVCVCVKIYLLRIKSSHLRLRNVNTLCRSLNQHKGCSSRTWLALELQDKKHKSVSFWDLPCGKAKASSRPHWIRLYPHKDSDLSHFHLLPFWSPHLLKWLSSLISSAAAECLI